jgi:L-iditol 2-dehydrogenase
MKALMKLQRGEGFVELREIEDPVPKPDEVLVAVKRAGVCGTDIHILHDEFPKARPPFVLGHEFSGVIEDVGREVRDWKAGDRVVSETSAYYCGHCRFCRTGDTQLCPERQAYGYVQNGAFARFIVVKANLLHCIPDSVGYPEAALCEPVAVCVHSVLERVKVEPAEIALVTGPGAIGLIMLQVVKSTGTKVILCGTDSDRERLRLGNELGADRTVNIEREDLAPVVMEMTGGYGVDKSYECAGAKSAVADCLRLTRRGGTIVQVGLFGRPIEIPYEEIALKELSVIGCFAQNHHCWEPTLRLLEEGKVKTGSIISGEYPLDRWKEAFDRSERREGLKYLLYPKE